MSEKTDSTTTTTTTTTTTAVTAPTTTSVTTTVSIWSGIHWPKVLLQLHIHLFFIYGLVFLFRAKFWTLAFGLYLVPEEWMQEQSFLLIGLGLLGATAGAHRLWAHRSYEANGFLRFLLVLFHTIGGTGTIYEYVLNHRIHHKYDSTDDDPYNLEKGFFYSHLGSRVRQKDSRREKIASEIDMSDIEKDKFVMFQKRFYWPLMAIVCLLLPINAPVEYWKEDILTSLLILGLFRIPVTLHGVWLIESARHIWQLKPNDRFYSDSNLIFVILKTHWHSYHYAAPWDCLTGEYGTYNRGCTTIFIKICAALGIATKLKTLDAKMVTSALEQSLDTGKRIQECLLDAREKVELSQYEDFTLDIIQSSSLH